MTSFNVAGIGEVLWDVYHGQKYPGGAPANFAAHISQYGMNSVLISRVGRDELGAALIAEMQSLSILIDGIQTDAEHPTGTVRVTLDANGVPSFQCSRNVAFDHLTWNNSLKTRLPTLDGVLFGTLAQRNPDSRATIQQCLRHMNTGVKLFDINIREWNNSIKDVVLQSLELSNIIKMNEEELTTLKAALSSRSQSNREFIQELVRNYGLKLAAVTRGAEGCVLMTKSEQTEHPGFKVNAVDTTGSGDAFAAGLMISLLENRSLYETAEFANRLGAFVATRRGAIPRWTLKELYDYE